MGLVGMVERCHELENRLAECDGALSGADKRPLLEWWQALGDNIRDLLTGSDEIIIDPEDFALLEADISNHTPHRELLLKLRHLRLESVRVRLGRLGRQAEALAARLGRGPITVHIEEDGLRLDSERWSDFWSALVHVVRNSIDHGIEHPEQRAAQNKAPPALWLRAHHTNGAITVEVEDNGHGIRWDAIARKAAARGLRTDTQEALEAALFCDGVSSRDEVSDTSGRGVGMAAVAAATHALGGQITIDSRAGAGTRFRFTFAPRLALSA